MHSLARYRVLQALGEGASASVFLVEDRVLGGPPLALKRIQAAADPELRQAFAREFAVLASLSIAGVGRVHDLGVVQASGDDVGGPFFTRDYVEGEPLQRWARERALREQLAVFQRVLAIVGQLHRGAVLHGDLHPGNVIVDATGAPHLIDFGLASQGTQRLRASGTPAFMAPELLAGGASTMSADLYALSATFWFALTGAAPFAELGARALGAKLQGQLPSHAGHSGPIARVLEALRVGLMADPKARVPSADELAATLERVMDAPLPAPLPQRAGFVPPRPRGRDPLSARLLHAAQQAAPVLNVVHGARGLGKSTVLRELKWRLQIAGAQVLEVRCREGAGSPSAQLARQLAVFDGAVAALLEEPGELLSEAAAFERICAVMGASLRRGPGNHERYTLLVDDLDDDDGLFAALLRAALQGPDARSPFVLATCQAPSARGVASFVDLEAWSLEPLAETDVRALALEALGPVDQAALARLTAYAQGNPGMLSEALSWCAQNGDSADIGELAPGSLAKGLAEQALADLAVAGRELLTVLALSRTPLPEHALEDWVGTTYASVRSELCERQLARAEAELLVACEPRVVEHLRSESCRALAEPLARRCLGHAASLAFSPLAQLELAVVARDRARARKVLGEALAELADDRATRRAARLCDQALALELREPFVLLQASELSLELGDGARAAELAEELLARPEREALTSARARVAAGRAHVLCGRLERAVERLSEVGEGAPAGLRVQAARELARVHLRRGAAQDARAAIAEGLAVAAPDDPNRAELLAIDATLLSQDGDHVRAATRFEEAIAAVGAQGSARDRAQILGYRAMSHERRGALDEARRDYEAGSEAARLAGDLGLTGTYALNLGNVGFRSGRLSEVEQHYALAARLTRRAGRVSTALVADNNLANLHVHFGSFARARLLAEATLAEAEALANAHAHAQALHILGEVDARSGRGEAALAHFEAAAARYVPLGRHHEVAEIWLDASELLLDRGGVSDISAGAAKLALARDSVERYGHDDLRARLRMLLARARAGHGDVDGAAKDLVELAAGLHRERERDTLWQVLYAASVLHGQLGAGVIASREAREAAELVELSSAEVPREVREAFLAEPRRRAVLELAREQARQTHVQADQPHVALTLDEPRFARLLELIKRLARERDLARLLERITDAAVDLSGAERGFVLLVDATGQLAPHTVRASGGAQADPHVAFSRSIAEAVLIDGEPIVTVNARDDRRLNEFMSVHKLMLKSVACIPISGPSGVVGVLYLEHRLRAGRFQEDDIDLLVAFADQAAIALENARLWSENVRRSEELEGKAGELAAAKAEIERLLEARTEELEQVRRDLGRARAQLEDQHSRHGIVGQSAPMRRVFALIERVTDQPVPVVVEGESGTGKELVARAIHFSGARKKAPFVALNCAALPEHLLESELFGHVRGAFTGADRDKRGLFTQAEGGTIFLDEFADMSPRMQLDLLRVLQERRIRPVGADADIPIDVRIIAASNRPLKQLVATGRLREDLYYRMSVVEIKLPALRERSDDIPLLCDHLLSRIAAGGRPRKLSRAALEGLMRAELPGNVRQLEHLLTSAAMLADGPLIEPSDLALEGAHEEESPSFSSRPPAALQDVAGDVMPGDLQGFKTRERRRILDALEQHGWNRAKAATALGMPRRTFYRRLTEFNIL